MKIVAVSTCTAGIAHTYMSQEALEQECEKELGTSPDIDLLLSIVNEIEKAFQVHFTKG